MADPEQSRRFIEMARELGCDETGEAFERGFALLAAAVKAGVPVPEKPRAESRRRRGSKAGFPPDQDA